MAGIPLNSVFHFLDSENLGTASEVGTKTVKTIEYCITGL